MAHMAGREKTVPECDLFTRELDPMLDHGTAMMADVSENACNR